MSIVIHIGYPKTATTWFQKNFFPYVQSSHTNIPREEIVSKIIHPHALYIDAKDIRAYFISKYGQNLILSLEGFIGTTHNFGLNGYMTKEHAQRIHQIFPEAEIILFIRRQQDIIASSYYQYIRGGGTYGLNKYLNKSYYRGLNGLPLFSYNFFEYDKVMGVYAGLFGKKQLHTYLYEEFETNNDSFVMDFSESFGLNIDFSNVVYNREKQKLRLGIKWLHQMANLFTARKMLNKYYVMHVPLWFNIYKPILQKMNRYKIFGKRPSTLQILGRKNLNLIEEHYRESNKRLITDYGLEAIKKYNYPL